MLLLRLREPLDQLAVVELAELGRLRCHRYASSWRDDEAGLDRQLVHREPHRLARGLLGHTGELEHDPARLHDRDPVLGVALARAHAGLGRLLGDRLVGEDA